MVETETSRHCPDCVYGDKKDSNCWEHQLQVPSPAICANQKDGGAEQLSPKDLAHDGQVVNIIHHHQAKERKLELDDWGRKGTRIRRVGLCTSIGTVCVIRRKSRL